jgi:ATP synthase protein I
MDEKEKRRESTAETVRQLGALSTVGISVVLAIAIGTGLGYLLMTRFGFGRWVFFVGFALGAAAGVVNIYRTAGRILK